MYIGIISVLNLIICSSWLHCLKVELRILYCNIWWKVREEYGKYTVLRRSSKNRGIMANNLWTGVIICIHNVSHNIIIIAMLPLISWLFEVHLIQ